MSVPVRSRRADILAAACREFARSGYVGGRIERIAAAAGVNKQLLFHYFESKDGLFTAAITHLLDEVEPESESSGSPADALRRRAGVLQAAVEAVPSLGALLADAQVSGQLPPAAAAALLSWRRRQLERLTLALEDGQRRGYFRDDMDPVMTAQLGFAAAIGRGSLNDLKPAASLSSFLVDYCAWR